MKKVEVWYAIGFSFKDKEELLEIFKNYPKWTDRVNKATGFLVSQEENYENNQVYAASKVQRNKKTFRKS